MICVARGFYKFTKQVTKFGFQSDGFGFHRRAASMEGKHSCTPKLHSVGVMS